MRDMDALMTELLGEIACPEDSKEFLICLMRAICAHLVGLTYGNIKEAHAGLDALISDARKDLDNIASFVSQDISQDTVH